MWSRTVVFCYAHMLTGRLLKPSHLKSVDFTESKLVYFLRKIAPNQLSKLTPFSATILVNKALSTIKNYIARTAALDANLDKIISPEDKKILFLRTGELELAASQIKVKSDKLSLLRLEVQLTTKMALSPQSEYALMFSKALKLNDFALLTELWDQKSQFRDLPLTTNMLADFAKVAAQNKNLKILNEICNLTMFDVPISSQLVASILSQFSFKRLLYVLDLHHKWLNEVVNYKDMYKVSDLLAEHVLEIDVKSCFVGNLVLQGLYRNNSSVVVLHYYRKLALNNFIGNEQTASILANACYRLGNSKLLMNRVYKELKPKSRHFFETWIACQLVGTNYTSTMFVLAEMARNGVPLRKHIQTQLYRKFDSVGMLQTLLEMAKPDFKSKFTLFDEQLADSEVPGTQAKRNVEWFNGTGTLEELLEFDKRMKK